VKLLNKKVKLQQEGQPGSLKFSYNF